MVCAIDGGFNISLLRITGCSDIGHVNLYVISLKYFVFPIVQCPFLFVVVFR